MSQVAWQTIWDGALNVPIGTRKQKPRDCGLTMVMDKGLGVNETSELLSVGSRYIDYIKLAFGTPALYPPELLKSKLALIRSHFIHVYPGGTFFEIAIMQNKTRDFIDRAWDMGFSAIEVSDGTVPVSPDTRRQAIELAAKKGFQVISEVGKKDPSHSLRVHETAEQVKDDIQSGAYKVILEARESGKGIGFYNNCGELYRDKLDELINLIPDKNAVIWEAPLKSQQQELILSLGENVNLGNIAPTEVLALESLRLGLRGDTLRTIINKNEAGSKL